MSVQLCDHLTACTLAPYLFFQSQGVKRVQTSKLCGRALQGCCPAGVTGNLAAAWIGFGTTNFARATTQAGRGYICVRRSWQH